MPATTAADTPNAFLASLPRAIRRRLLRDRTWRRWTAAWVGGSVLGVVVLTSLFEFGFGHYVDGKSWSELFENYNIAGGHLWLLVLVQIAVGPAVVRTLRVRRS